jgi:sulfonate transport system substrate-binding protein
MRITRRSVLALAGLSAATLSLSGCSEKSRAAAPPEGKGRKKIRLTHGVLSVARSRGVFEKGLAQQGIDVEWLGPYPNHAPTLQAVATDTADLSFGGSSTPALQAILSGSDLVFVAWTVSRPRTTSILVLPNSSIRSVKDLVGKTVAMNRAGVAEFLFVAALEKYGVPRDQVKISYLNPPDAAPAFAAGKVDAWAIWSGPMEMAEVQYGARPIFVEGDELDFEIDFGTYLAKRSYVEREADTMRAVIRAHQAELAWVADHYIEAQEYTYKLAKYPKAVQEKLNQRVRTSTLRFMDDEAIATLQRSADWLRERKILSGKVDVAAHTVRL